MEPGTQSALEQGDRYPDPNRAVIPGDSVEAEATQVSEGADQEDVSRATPREITLKYTRKILKRGLVLLIVGYISPPVLILFLVTGIYDVVRHGQNLAEVFHRYFLINGSLAWLFSPINALVDILSLPNINKKIYKLTDFPASYQEEIRTVTEGCPKEEIIAEVSRRSGSDPRSMLIYQWYGYKNPGVRSELFQQDFKHILTIGVSTFQKQKGTKRHFGWLRAGIRVLYNIDDLTDDRAFINVNGIRHTWSKDGPLFIFDNTILHQSLNLTDKDRHCLFIDIVRPSYFSGLIRGFIVLFGIVAARLSLLKHSSKWRMI
ncbi:MAG: aspartyl beta-hydroxylase [Chromatiales bacterium]|jgi:beta-hydroxylase|nr:aspartyl beta-hydroxylase [Chromatiales bacterium]